MPKILVILLFFIIPFQLKSQIQPKEGSKLSYRIIGLSFPQETQAHNYKIEIAAGNYNTIDSFRKNIVRSAESESNKIIAEVPSFGTQYTWRIVYEDKKTVINNSALHHFTTQINLH